MEIKCSKVAAKVRPLSPPEETHSDPYSSPDVASPIFPPKRRNSAEDKPKAVSSPVLLAHTRKRAQTMPVLTKRKLRDMKLRVVLMPLAPETDVTPASPPARASKKRWQPRAKLRAAAPPPPSEYVRFTPSGVTYDSFEDYKAATIGIREKIKKHGTMIGETLVSSTVVRRSPLISAVKGNDMCFTLDC